MQLLSRWAMGEVNRYYERLFNKKKKGLDVRQTRRMVYDKKEWCGSMSMAKTTTLQGLYSFAFLLPHGEGMWCCMMD